MACSVRRNVAAGLDLGEVDRLTMRSVETQLFLRDLDAKALRTQQEANQRDINRLIDEQYYIKEEMMRMRR